MFYILSLGPWWIDGMKINSNSIPWSVPKLSNSDLGVCTQTILSSLLLTFNYSVSILTMLSQSDWKIDSLLVTYQTLLKGLTTLCTWKFVFQWKCEKHIYTTCITVDECRGCLANRLQRVNNESIYCSVLIIQCILLLTTKNLPLLAAGRSCMSHCQALAATVIKFRHKCDCVVHYMTVKFTLFFFFWSSISFKQTCFAP
jgi:hypothetical protein